MAKDARDDECTSLGDKQRKRASSRERSACIRLPSQRKRSPDNRGRRRWTQWPEGQVQDRPSCIGNERGQSAAGWGKEGGRRESTETRSGTDTRRCIASEQCRKHTVTKRTQAGMKTTQSERRTESRMISYLKGRRHILTTEASVSKP